MPKESCICFVNSGVVPDDTFTVTQAINAIGFGKFQIILSMVRVLNI